MKRLVLLLLAVALVGCSSSAGEKTNPISPDYYDDSKPIEGEMSFYEAMELFGFYDDAIEYVRHYYGLYDLCEAFPETGGDECVNVVKMIKESDIGSFRDLYSEFDDDDILLDYLFVTNALNDIMEAYGVYSAQDLIYGTDDETAAGFYHLEVLKTWGGYEDLEAWYYEEYLPKQ